MKQQTELEIDKPIDRRSSGWMLWPIVLLLVASVCLITLLMPAGAASSQDGNFLSISLHSQEEADYSSDITSRPVPAISLNIIQDVLLLEDSDHTDLPARLATLTAILQTPVPTATSPPPKSGTGASTPNLLPSPTAVSRSSPTSEATSSPGATATSPPTIQTTGLSPTSAPATTIFPVVATTIAVHPTQTGVATAFQSPTATPTPTVTPDRSPTGTAASTPISTWTPTATPTSKPFDTATPRPTPTRTPTVISTSVPTDTPVPSATFTSTPSPTNVPVSTATFTPTPTVQPTATPATCSPPHSTYGFVGSVSPPDGSVDVAAAVYPVILFNQSMNPATLITNSAAPDKNIALCRVSNCNDPQDPVPAALIVFSTNVADDTVRISPDSDLELGISYYIVAGNTIKNSCGVKQGLKVKTIFTTVNSVTAHYHVGFVELR